MADSVLLIGTLDTKEEEFSFVRDIIRSNNIEAVLMDTGILQDPEDIKPDISAKEVAQAGGGSLQELRSLKDRTHALDVMTKGARKLTENLYKKERFEGILSLGGGSGTALATAAMRELPVGAPKLMVSSVASGDISPYVDIKDITFMYSVADISGLNRLSRRILSNAAEAICGMVSQERNDEIDKPLLAATMFGVTTPCVSAVRTKLEAHGYEMVVFHATGSGGRAMEGMIEDGYITGVADITTTEWCDEVVGGVLSAGPARLEAAGKAGIPQVVSCGALDMVNFHAMDSVPDKFQARNLHRHTSQVTLMRTTPRECEEIGKNIARKLNQAKGPVVLMLPLRGVSMIDREDEPFFDPDANQALFDSLKKNINSGVTVKELDLHINDPAFAEAIAEEMLNILKQ